MHGRKIMEFANNIEYENISDEFYTWQNLPKTSSLQDIDFVLTKNVRVSLMGFILGGV